MISDISDDKYHSIYYIILHNLAPLDGGDNLGLKGTLWENLGSVHPDLSELKNKSGVTQLLPTG